MAIGATNIINGDIGHNLSSGAFQGTGLGVLTSSLDGTYCKLFGLISSLRTEYCLMIPATTNATMAVNGKVFATDYKPATPANLAQAMLDMESAYRFGMAEGPPTNIAPVGAYELGGQTLGPGM